LNGKSHDCIVSCVDETKGYKHW